MRQLAVTVVVIAATWATNASAETDPVAHLALGLGGGSGPTSGFRASLDAAGGPLFITRHNGYGLGGADIGWALQAGVVSGFGKYPTYVLAEAGANRFSVLSTGFGVGPVVRLDHGVASGIEAGAAVAVLFFRGGLRAIVVPNGGDVQVQATIGVGLP